MDYRKVYINIINKVKQENRKKFKGTYYAAHHILPKSLFPLWIKRKSNTVLLTAREHFFCHQLLVKIYPSMKMWCSLIFFCNNTNQGKNIVKGSREYERIINQYREYINSEDYKNYFRERMNIIWTDEKREEARIKSINIRKEYLQNNPDYLKNIELRKLVRLLGKYRNKRIREENRKIKEENKRIIRKEKKQNRKISNKSCKKIICLETKEIFNSIKAAAELLKVPYQNISRVLQEKSRNKSIHGYHFKYYDGTSPELYEAPPKEKQHRTEEQKRYLSELNKGRKLSSFYGKHHTEESKRKNSETNKERWKKKRELEKTASAFYSIFNK